MAGDDTPQLEFGSRGEEITYRIAGRTAEISFTWIDGPRIYVDGINTWADGAADRWAETEPGLASLSAASVLGVPAGYRAWRIAWRLGHQGATCRRHVAASESLIGRVDAAEFRV